MLIEVASIVWSQIPKYQSLQPPSFSGGWVEKFKVRHKIKTQSVAGEAASFYPPVSNPAHGYHISYSCPLTSYIAGSFNYQLVYNQAYSNTPSVYQHSRNSLPNLQVNRSVSFSAPSSSIIQQQQQQTQYVLPETSVSSPSNINATPHHHIRSYSTSENGRPSLLNAQQQQQHLTASKISDAKRSLASLLATIANYSPDNIFTMNETLLSYRAAPTASSIKRATDSRESAEFISVALCYNASGSERLMPWVIGQVQDPVSVQVASFQSTNEESTHPVTSPASNATSIGHPPGTGPGFSTYKCIENVQYSANSISWMGMSDFRSWLRWFDSQMEGRSVLLVLDPFKAHEVGYRSIMPTLRNVAVRFTPGYLANKCLPPDLGAIYNFKAEYRKTLLKYLTYALDKKWNLAVDLLPPGYSNGPIAFLIADQARAIYNSRLDTTTQQQLSRTQNPAAARTDQGSPKALLDSINIHIALYWVAQAWIKVSEPLLQDSWTRSGLLPATYQPHQTDYHNPQSSQLGLANIDGRPITSVPVNIPANGPTYVPETTLDTITNMIITLQSGLGPQLFTSPVSLAEFDMPQANSPLHAHVFVGPTEEYAQEYPSEFVEISTASFRKPAVQNEYLSNPTVLAGPLSLTLAIRAIDTLLETEATNTLQLQSLKSLYESQLEDAKKQYAKSQNQLDKFSISQQQQQQPVRSSSSISSLINTQSSRMFEWQNTTFKSPVSPSNAYSSPIYAQISPKRRRTSSHSSTMSSSSLSYPLSMSSSTDSTVAGSSLSSLSGFSNSAFSSGANVSLSQKRRQSSASSTSIKSPLLLGSPTSSTANPPGLGFMSRNSSISSQTAGLSPISAGQNMLPRPSSTSASVGAFGGVAGTNNNSLMMAMGNDINSSLQFGLNSLNFNFVSQAGSDAPTSFGFNNQSLGNGPKAGAEGASDSTLAAPPGSHLSGASLSPLTLTSSVPLGTSYTNHYASPSTNLVTARQNSNNYMGSNSVYPVGSYNYTQTHPASSSSSYSQTAPSSSTVYGSEGYSAKYGGLGTEYGGSSLNNYQGFGNTMLNPLRYDAAAPNTANQNGDEPRDAASSVDTLKRGPGQIYDDTFPEERW